jgi:hypothetical protein
MSAPITLRRPVLALLAIVALAGCSDHFFVEPARVPAALGLAYSVAPGLSADMTAAFDRADRVRITVTGPGVSLDTIIPFAPAPETRVPLEIPGAQDGATYQVNSELRRGGDVLFVASVTVTLSVGQTTQAAIPLQPVPSRVELPSAEVLATVLGQPIPLRAAVLFATGDTIPAAPVTWLSSNVAVATVDAQGTVTPHTDGSAIITARSGPAAASMTLTVLETPARVVRVCQTGTGRTYPTLQMAVDSVASGGTIRFCSGTFVTDTVRLQQPVTLEAEPGADATVSAGSSAYAILVQHPTGTVTIRGLGLIDGTMGSLGTLNNFGDIVIEDVSVTGAGTSRGLQFVTTTGNAAHVTVRNVTARNGGHGIFAHGAFRLDVLDSRFEGHTLSNIQIQQGTSGTVLRNNITECGGVGCIRVRFAGDVLIAHNVARTTARTDVITNGVSLGIAADGANVRVERNLVEGIGTITDIRDRTSYPIRASAMVVIGEGGRATFTANTVRNAATAFSAFTEEPGPNPPMLIGRDNVVVTAQTVIGTTNGAFDLQRSDFTNYDNPIFVSGAPLASGSLACNWWGNPAGPQNPNPPVDPSVWSPAAVGPIAGTSTPCPAAGTSTLSGTVVNASNSEPVADATVALLQNGSVVASTVTTQSGGYSFSQLAAGTYDVRIAAAGFVDFASDIVIGSNATVTRTFALVTATSGDQVRIVLTWGAAPADLDSHLLVPAFEGNDSTRVFYADPGSDTSYPFATLDNDRTSGFGPETIRIEQQLPGTYTYMVHNYSGSPALSTSSAVVEVYRGNTRIATFDVPDQPGDLWTVFSLNGATLTPINTMSDMSDESPQQPPDAQSAGASGKR